MYIGTQGPHLDLDHLADRQNYLLGDEWGD